MVESVSLRCADLDAMVVEVDRVLEEGDQSIVSDDGLVESLFGPQDGHAHLRVADVIEAAGTTPADLDHRRLRSLHYHPDSAGSRTSQAMRSLRDITRLPALYSFRQRKQLAPEKWDASEKAFGPDDVTPLLSALDQVSPDDRGRAEVVAAPPTDYHHRFAVGRAVRITRATG